MKPLFHKYHAAGNDFIILDNRSQSYQQWLTELIPQLCHRHFGIGADGIITLNNFSPEANIAEISIYNSDGGAASMCANGTRCMVHFLKKQNLITSQVKIKTLSGTYNCSIQHDDVTLIMQKNILQPIIPTEKHHWGISSSYQFFGDTGVPHAIFFVENVARVPLSEWAPTVRHHPMFPHGINVNIVEVIPQEQKIVLRTYERGVEGETLSCGTGIIAAAWACAEHLQWKGNIHVVAKGGNFEVLLTQDSISYCGKVHCCFTGNYLEC